LHSADRCRGAGLLQSSIVTAADSDAFAAFAALLPLLLLLLLLLLLFLLFSLLRLLLHLLMFSLPPLLLLHPRSGHCIGAVVASPGRHFHGHYLVQNSIFALPTRWSGLYMTLCCLLHAR
jgi:hypothetical protein